MLEPVDCTDDTFTPDMFKGDQVDPKFKMLQDILKKDAKPMSKEDYLA